MYNLNNYDELRIDRWRACVNKMNVLFNVANICLFISMTISSIVAALCLVSILWAFISKTNLNIDYVMDRKAIFTPGYQWLYSILLNIVESISYNPG